MSGFFSNQAKKNDSLGPTTHGRERLDFQLPDIAHIKLSEWAFCTSASLNNATAGQVQPNIIEPILVLGGTRWQPQVFAYQNNDGVRDTSEEFTSDNGTAIPLAGNPCVRTIMPLNVLWGPYSRHNSSITISDSLYNGFSERVWPYGISSLFPRYQYVRVKKCYVTLQFTNWSRESFNGVVCINRNDVSGNGIDPASYGSGTSRGRQPRSFYNSIPFTVHGNSLSETLNPASVAAYNTDSENFSKPRVTYVRFEVDMRHLFADLEWKFDAMARDTVDSNFWYSFSQHLGADKPRPNVIGYYQVLLNRKYHGDDETTVRGPTLAIRHTWDVELGRQQDADIEPGSYTEII